MRYISTDQILEMLNSNSQRIISIDKTLTTGWFSYKEHQDLENKWKELKHKEMFLNHLLSEAKEIK